MTTITTISKIKFFRREWSKRLKIMKKTLPNGNKLLADINKMKNLPCFSCEKTDMLIGFSVVGLAKNTPWILNLRNLRKNSERLRDQAYFRFMMI